MTPNVQQRPTEAPASPPDAHPPEKSRGIITWLRRIGIVGFLFFLAKGIVWLFVLWGGSRLLGCD